MKLDIVLPTFNRWQQLQGALQSVADAHAPDGVSVRAIIVDNNSTDDTRRVIRKFLARTELDGLYVFEPSQGRSHALNAGIAAGDGDLVGMIDDDEEIAEDWVEVGTAAFRQNPGLDFIGGPYRGLWSIPAPRWVPDDYPSVIGVLDAGPERFSYAVDSGSVLPGGNAVIRRSVLQRVGLYSADLGRSGERLQGAEDVDMFKRLLAIGAYGEYLPNLIIHHHVPPERLSKTYFRRWAGDHGQSLAVLDRHHPPPVALLAGVPRWIAGQALRSLGRMLFQPYRARTAPDRFFADELRLREFAGYLKTRWLHHT